MPPITRRRLLTGLASSIAIGPVIGCATGRPFTADPFTLGVASGDPDNTSVVLWTRLAPAPLRPDGGMPSVAVPIGWEVAADGGMKQIVRSGVIEARPQDGHSVHVVADGLQPGRPYWYRFTTRDAQSPIGRTRTLPLSSSRPAQFRLAVAGCQNIEHGYFTGWADIADSDVDAVFHYGDYIYEGALQKKQMMARIGRPVTTEVLPALSSLAQYRMRYALYKLDPDLAAAHASHPFIASFDDHEVSGNWGGDDSGSHAMDTATFRGLRAAAFQAFYENMPLRPQQRPRGAEVTMYRALQVGSLLRFAVLDTRQFRSPPACGKAEARHCNERHGTERSMLGAEQEAWLTSLFRRNDVVWTALGNQVMMMQRRLRDPALDIVNTDKWDGYVASRRRLLQAAADHRVAGLITLTGDAHRSFVGDLKLDFDDRTSPPVGTEFLASSISSGGDRATEPGARKRLLVANPHMRYYDGRRGYVICQFDERQCEATYRGIDYVSRKGSPVRTLARFTVDAKRPGVA